MEKEKNVPAAGVLTLQEKEENEQGNAAESALKEVQLPRYSQCKLGMKEGSRSFA